MTIEQLAEQLDQETAVTPFVRSGGSFLLLAGLPGSGKSSIVAHLQHHFATVTISTDEVRTRLQQNNRYTAVAMEQVYAVCYALIERRLQAGQRVVFDATNYLAARRQHVIRLAQRMGAAVAIAMVQAAQETIRQRLQQRTKQQSATDLSDADWSVYKWMVEVQEPIAEPHLILDTTTSLPESLAVQLTHYWLQVEDRAPGNFNLQSYRRTN